MKYVEFYELKDAKYEKVGEVRLVGIGSDRLEYHGPKADALRSILENNAVVDHSVMPNVPHYPSDGDKEKYSVSCRKDSVVLTFVRPKY